MTGWLAAWLVSHVAMSSLIFGCPFSLGRPHAAMKREEGKSEDETRGAMALWTCGDGGKQLQYDCTRAHIRLIYT